MPKINKNTKEQQHIEKSVGVKYQPLYVTQIHIAPSDEKWYPIPANLIKSVEARQHLDEVENNKTLEESIRFKLHQGSCIRNNKGFWSWIYL